MPVDWDPCDRVVDHNFSKLVADVQLVVAGIAQRMDQLKVEQSDAAAEYVQQLQQIQLPEVESLCQEIRNSGDKLIGRVNEALKQLMTAITTSVSNEMRRVTRTVADDCLKSLSDNRRKRETEDGNGRCDFLLRSHIEQINQRLRHISQVIFSLNHQNRLLSQIEQQLGLDSGEEDRSRKVQQLLHSSLWSDQTPAEPPPSPDPGPFPQLCQSAQPSESLQSEVLSSPAGGQRCEAAHSATKDRTFAEILSDGDNSSIKWEKKAASERKSCCRKVPE